MISGKKVYLLLLIFIIFMISGWTLTKENNNKVAIRGLVKVKKMK